MTGKTNVYPLSHKAKKHCRTALGRMAVLYKSCVCIEAIDSGLDSSPREVLAKLTNEFGRDVEGRSFAAFRWWRPAHVVFFSPTDILTEGRTLWTSDDQNATRSSPDFIRSQDSRSFKYLFIWLYIKSLW